MINKFCNFRYTCIFKFYNAKHQLQTHNFINNLRSTFCQYFFVFESDLRVVLTISGDKITSRGKPSNY